MTTTQLILTIFGVIAFFAVGSFTCVIIDRMPRHLDEENEFGERWDTNTWAYVLGGNSRCSTCGEPVRAIDNIPVVSWLVLRGRCRGCGDRIPAFHPLVEVAAPALFLIAIIALGADWRLLLIGWLIPVGLAIAVIDLRTMIVPTRLVWPATAVSVVLAVIVASIEGEWMWLASGAVGLLVLAGPLFVLWWFFARAMGFGDVRLATLIGFNVGFFAGSSLAEAAFLAVVTMVLASALGLALGLAVLGARGRKAKVPFGPTIVLGGYLCIIFAAQILGPLRIG